MFCNDAAPFRVVVVAVAAAADDDDDGRIGRSALLP